MLDTSSEKAIIDLGEWLQTATGLYVREWEQRHLNALTADIFGFNAVQIGLPEISALQANRMPHRWRTDAQVPARPAKVQAGETAAPAADAIPLVVAHDFAELPFATQSLDLVVLPHLLEFAAEPHQVLREVERVLIPEGQVIICGFNPASLWGMRQAFGRLSGAPFLPRESEFISLPRLKDWLKLLNMEVDHGQYGCYAPPCATEKWLQRFHFMETAGTRWWPYFGAVYVVRAIKRVQGMRLIGPVWNKRQAATSRAVAATNKAANPTGARQRIK